MIQKVSSTDSRSRRLPWFRTITWILIVLTSSFLSFYVGVWTGIHASVGDGGQARNDGAVSNAPNLAELQRQAEELSKLIIASQLPDLCKTFSSATSADGHQTPPIKNENGGSPLLSNSLRNIAQGLARVSKGELMRTYDLGVPINAGTENLDALILYTSLEALPSDANVARAARHEDPTKPLPLLSASAATENCDTMNVILMDRLDHARQCFALVGDQYRSYHIQRWMRRPDDEGILDSNMPLKLTSRGWTIEGRQEYVPPGPIISKHHQKRLLTYLSEVEDIKSRLKKTLAKMKGNTVVVMTCNHGQSELLMNFACSSRARGFDLHNVIVFPTDMETKELTEGIGLTTFYEEKLMASIPKEESETYGDEIFADVMFAKVLCVQLVNELGYDLLFQDVDLVWFKSPLDFFQEKSLLTFDMYFQDDGNRQLRFAPYSANSGFYFVRSNAKTRHLFRHFLYAGDLINAWYSHQAVLIALLGEHSSLMGLTVKIYSKETEEFPGGLHFHRKKEVMKAIMSGNSKAYIFHMSWTNNKDDKVKFFQQLGEWYVNEQCIGKEAHEIASTKKGEGITNGILLSKCCSAEPIFKCHYRDKPSKIPCPDSPYTIKKPGESADISFW
ncbi:hypothetical protein ACHAXA_010845 [Cyclostephanos tholiformis]|uniref:Nucleotide-diphospho-sugar transferase domain-containing protein n=1 Tax=Cyclostephanos tholiformis TaxID=382380 RepID=A0ABD3R0V5_9STRA